MPENARKKLIGVQDRELRGSRITELLKMFSFRPGGELNLVQLGEWVGNHCHGKPYQPGHVSQWNTGLRPMPYAEVSLTFGVSVDWLMMLTDETDIPWNRTVVRLREALKAYLLSLPGEKKAEIASPRLDPAARIRIVIDFCQEREPGLCTQKYFAGFMHMDESDLNDVLTGRTYAVAEWYERLAEWADLPSTWFTNGELILPNDPRVTAYLPAIVKAINRRVGPERLNQVVDFVSP